MSAKKQTGHNSLTETYLNRDGAPATYSVTLSERIESKGHSRRSSRRSIGDRAPFKLKRWIKAWIPAFAGMTALWISSPAHSATITAASCTQAAIQAAIDLAQDGDTVRIPPGRAEFFSAIEVNKSLVILGAGIDSTLINDNSTPNGILKLSALGFVRLSGFTLTGQMGNWSGSIRVHSNNKRIDHVRFDQTNRRHRS